jgi:hypothetical protein
MRTEIPTIRLLSKQGWLAARDGVVMSFFIHHPPEEVAPAVWRALQTYLRAIPAGVLGWYVSDTGDMSPLDDEGWEQIRRYLLEPPWNGVWAIELSENPGEAGGYQFEFYGRRLDDPALKNAVTSISFTFPTEYLHEHGAVRLRELASELSLELPFNHGYAGPALVSPQGLFSAGNWDSLDELLTRYAGLEVFHTRAFSKVLGTQSLGAHWLTFLGQPLLGRLGGAEAVARELSTPGTHCMPMDGDRLLITLGEWPDPIDTEAAPIPPQYRGLARLLEPFMYDYKGDTDWLLLHMNRWQRRLLR